MLFWSLLSIKWSWNLPIYDDFFKTAVALTNAYVKDHPLHCEDGERLAQIRNHLAHIANEAAEKRRSSIQRYRNQLRTPLSHHFCPDQYAASGEHLSSYLHSYYVFFLLLICFVILI